MLYPDLAAQWHPTRNGQLRPQQVTTGSGKKVWWRCPADHDWEAVVYSRTKAGTGCPVCAGFAQVLDRWMAKRGILALDEHRSNVILAPGAEPAAARQRPRPRSRSSRSR